MAAVHAVANTESRFFALPGGCETRQGLVFICLQKAKIRVRMFINWPGIVIDEIIHAFLYSICKELLVKTV